MAPFRFRLENILAHRKRMEEEAMQTLAGAVLRRDNLLARREALRKSRAEHRERLCRAHLLTAAERWFLQGCLQILKQDCEAAEKDLLQAGEEIDRCRADLVRKAQERRLLDRLKEKQAVAHATLERQKEQRAFDEAATLRYTPAPL